jgi:hypothetical protein
MDIVILALTSTFIHSMLGTGYVILVDKNKYISSLFNAGRYVLNIISLQLVHENILTTCIIVGTITMIGSLIGIKIGETIIERRNKKLKENKDGI